MAEVPCWTVRAYRHGQRTALAHSQIRKTQSSGSKTERIYSLTGVKYNDEIVSWFLQIYAWFSNFRILLHNSTVINTRKKQLYSIHIKLNIQ